MGNAITLNDRTFRVDLFAVICIAVTAAIVGFLICGMAFADGGTFLGSGADKLLKDFATVIALCGVGVGIFNIVKGRTVMGIAVIVIAAIIYAFCKKPDLFSTVGNSILDIFGW